MKQIFLDELINRASKVAGNDSQLATKLGVTRANVSQWKHGHKTCPTADIALMAYIADMDATDWLARATIEQYAGTPKGEQLKQALKKAWLATGGAVATFGVSASSTSDVAHRASECYCLASECLAYFIRCILSQIPNTHYQWRRDNIVPGDKDHRPTPTNCMSVNITIVLCLERYMKLICPDIRASPDTPRHPQPPIDQQFQFFGPVIWDSAH